MKSIAILGLIDFENWSNKQSLSMGGSSGVIKSILPYLAADSIYLLGITSDKKKLNVLKRLENNINYLPIIYTPSNTIIPTRLLAFWYSREINTILDQYQIGSVYSHAEEMSYWVKPGRPIVYHMHGSSNALSIAKNKFHRNKLFQNLWEFARTKNIKKATKIIAIDRQCYNLTKKLHCEGKTLILPNFVDTNIFFKDTSKSEILNKIHQNILLFVGRIEEVKGLELFVDTVIELNRREADWKGVFVGGGTYESNIKNYITSKEAENLMYFTGPVFEQSELRRIYNQSSVLMIASYTEGIPMVILESLSCCTPVVSTNVGGIKEFIEDNETCYTNDSRDPQVYAELVLAIHKEKNHFENVDFNFSASKSAEKLNEILSL